MHSLANEEPESKDPYQQNLILNSWDLLRTIAHKLHPRLGYKGPSTA